MGDRRYSGRLSAFSFKALILQEPAKNGFEERSKIMSNKQFELIIIGGGAAGFAAATRADELNIKTAIINTGLPMGGTCVNVGCVPTKHFLAVGKELYSPKHPKFKRRV